MKKLVIIDDEYFFRQALIKYIGNFKDEFTVVGDAGNGKRKMTRGRQSCVVGERHAAPGDALALRTSHR